MKVPEKCLERLRAAKLLVSDPFVPNHLAFPDGIIVGKPKDVAGNGINGYEAHWDDVIVDAPSPRLHFDGMRWLVTVHELIPGPGPSDFVNSWDSADDAVTDIIDFLIDNPERMRLKRQEHAEHSAWLATLTSKSLG